MNILESQATTEIIGALQDALDEQGLTLDEADPRNDESTAVYTDGQIIILLKIEAARPENRAEGAL